MSSSILFPTNDTCVLIHSTEEIQKLMMPDLSFLETLNLILTKAHPLQLPYLFKNFHKFPKQMLTSVCTRLPKEDHENQVSIVQSLKKIRKEELGKAEVMEIFSCLLESLLNWTTINSQHLVEGIEWVVEICFDKAQLLQKLEKTAQEMGKPSEPIISKVIAGRIVPILSKYNNRSLKGELMDIIKRIITDSEAEAKKVFLQEIFPNLLLNLKLEFIELHLQEKIYEMVYDENEEIGLMALETILRFSTKFSLEEQGSRIVKLFIDSLTSKNEKIAIMVTSFMGETYQKLQGIVLKNEANCIKLWKSLIEVAESKNEKIVNNFIFNLPGILQLAKKYHRVDPLVEVYAELFFNPDSDTLLLTSFFHELVQMFPSRSKLLKETAYNLFSEVFESIEPSEDSMKIMNCLLCHLFEAKEVFLEECDRNGDEGYQDAGKTYQEVGKTHDEIGKTYHEIQVPYFEPNFNEIISKYLLVCLNKKNGCFIFNLFHSIRRCIDYFSPTFAESVLLPKLYSAIRNKTAHLDSLMQLIVSFLARDCSSTTLINNYASKINVELSKSTKGHEREAAMLFFYYCSFEFSIDTFHEFKMGQKFLQFNNEKNLKNKLLFIKYLPRLVYFFTREEKIQYSIILNRLSKETESEINHAIISTNFEESEQAKAEILLKSKAIKEKEKMRTTLNSKKVLFPNRRETKQLRKEDVLKKRLETRSRTKMLIKELPKKRTPITMSRPLRKNPPFA